MTRFRKRNNIPSKEANLQRSKDEMSNWELILQACKIWRQLVGNCIMDLVVTQVTGKIQNKIEKPITS